MLRIISVVNIYFVFSVSDDHKLNGSFLSWMYLLWMYVEYLVWHGTKLFNLIVLNIYFEKFCEDCMANKDNCGQMIQVEGHKIESYSSLLTSLVML